MEQSIVIREMTRRLNEDLRRNNSRRRADVTDIENDFVRDPGIISDKFREEVEAATVKFTELRAKAQKDVSGKISEAWGTAIGSLDQCLSMGDFLHGRLAFLMFRNASDVLLGKDPRHDEESVTGAFVKCLMLLSLYGKSCSVGSEISMMLKCGFSGAAMARLRTLYEHLVISSILGQDHSYEISERYHDHAVFEALQQMRAEKRAYADPVFVYPEGFLEELEGQIFEAENQARQARARWGSAVEEQYGWVRPLLPRAKRNKPRVYFTDLEQLAGMDFLRGDYLKGNDRIHAGPYAAINDFNLNDIYASPTHARRDDPMIFMVGHRAAFLLGSAGRTAGKAISWETEEYDEFLYVCEVERPADIAMEEFKLIDAGLSSSTGN